MASLQLTSEQFRPLGNTLRLLGARLDVLLNDDGVHSRDELRSLRLLTADALYSLRRLTSLLDTTSLRGRPLDEALRVLATAFTEATCAGVEVRTTGATAALPAVVSSTLLDVAYEALVNVDRYARASFLLLSLALGDGQAVLEIRDDGVGLAQRQVAEWRSATDFGLQSMARDVQSLGGSFQVVEEEPRGLRLRAVVPLRNRCGRC